MHRNKNSCEWCQVNSIWIPALYTHSFSDIRGLIMSHNLSAGRMLPFRLFSHDDVIEWNQFPRYWPFVRGIHRSLVTSPHKGQWRGALMSFFNLRLNKRLSKQSWGWWFETLSRPLWRHSNEIINTVKTQPTHSHIDMWGYSECINIFETYMYMWTISYSERSNQQMQPIHICFVDLKGRISDENTTMQPCQIWSVLSNVLARLIILAEAKQQ